MLGDALEAAGAFLAGFRSPATRKAQPWLYRNELTDLPAAAETEGGYDCVLVCLLGLHGLRVFVACGSDVGDLGGARHQPTLRIIGKGDKPPRSH